MSDADLFPERPPAPPPANPWPGRIGLAIGAVLAFLWSASISLKMAAEPPGPAAMAWGEATGAAMASFVLQGGIVWVVLYLLFLRSAKRGNGGKYFVVLGIAAALGTLPLFLRAAAAAAS